MEKKQTTNYAEYEHVDFFETALQCYPSYDVHTTASHHRTSERRDELRRRMARTAR